MPSRCQEKAGLAVGYLDYQRTLSLNSENWKPVDFVRVLAYLKVADKTSIVVLVLTKVLICVRGL